MTTANCAIFLPHLLLDKYKLRLYILLKYYIRESLSYQHKPLLEGL